LRRARWFVDLDQQTRACMTMHVVSDRAQPLLGGHSVPMRFRRKRDAPKPPAGGRPLRTDPEATSADPSAPAFVARPEGAPVYYGFPIIESSAVEGFRFGMITDFIAEPDTSGDAFVVAPDDTRAGLVWESEVAEPYFNEVAAPDADRWGVWAVGASEQLRTEGDARDYLRAILPELRSRWESWKGAR
jgi:hypothetical protein